MGIRRRGDYVWWKWSEGGVRVGSSYVQMTTSPVYLRFCRLYPFLLGYKSVFLNAVKFTQMLYIWKKHEKQTRGFLLIPIQKHIAFWYLCVLQGETPTAGWCGVWICGYSSISYAYIHYLHISLRCFFTPTSFVYYCFHFSFDYLRPF